MLTLGCERVRFRQVGSTFLLPWRGIRRLGLFCFLYPFLVEVSPVLWDCDWFSALVVAFQRVICALGWRRRRVGGAGVRWLRSSSKCAHVLQPEMVVSEAHHLSRSRQPLSLSPIWAALLLSLGFLYFRFFFFSPLSIVLQHFAQQIKEGKKQEANEKKFVFKIYFTF